MKAEKHQNNSNLLLKIVTIFIIIAALITVDMDYIISLYNAYAKEDLAIKSEVINNIQTETKPAMIEKPKSLELSTSLKEEIDRELLRSIQYDNIEQYKSYLYNASRLVCKFKEHKNYDLEIKALMSNKSILPKQICTKLLLLKAYNDKYYKDNFPQYDDVEIDSNIFKKFLSKIIVIKRKNKFYESMITEYESLKRDIEIIENYFYSTEFLRACFSDV